MEIKSIGRKYSYNKNDSIKINSRNNNMKYTLKEKISAGLIGLSSLVGGCNSPQNVNTNRQDTKSIGEKLDEYEKEQRQIKEEQRQKERVNELPPLGSIGN